MSDYLYWAEWYASEECNKLPRNRIETEELVWRCIFLQVEADDGIEQSVKKDFSTAFEKLKAIKIPRQPTVEEMTRRDGSKRSCVIRAKNLEELLETCDRHLSNIAKTHLDLLENEDITESDKFYIKMFEGVFRDLREDVEAMIQAQKV